MEMRQSSMFDEAMKLNKLTMLKDPLEVLNKHIDFEMFRPVLEKAIGRDKAKKAGRPAYDEVMMFKILILQRINNTSDEQTEFLIHDRATYQRFLGLHMASAVPDYTTIWQFREALTKAGVIKELFDLFTKSLAVKGLITHEGSIVDATFVEVPRQRNNRDENEMIKNGEVPPDWKEKPHKLSQKDVDARWTKKNDQTYYGYKNHVTVDAASLLITEYDVTDAAVHDSQQIDNLLEKEQEGTAILGDSAYKSAGIDEMLSEKGLKNLIHEKGSRNHPLDADSIKLNHAKSRIRCLVEHVFAFMENSMNGPELEYIGIKRNATGIGLQNLVYNFFRFTQLIKKGFVPAGAAHA